ncbi:MAG: glutamate--tRNA ligase family protein [Phycisphaerales bacterium]
MTRLAPSPTGALHLGNARTFLMNWAMARRAGWRVVLRVEDLDTPRVKPGVVDLTVDLLGWLGIDWDAGPVVQSGERAHHVAAVGELAGKGLVYPCGLTRREVGAAQGAPQEGDHEVVFPASLRPAVLPTAFSDVHPAWRFATPGVEVVFQDVFAGEQRVRPARTIGDFVVWTRREPAAAGQAAYQLAVVVDDARAGVTHVVRGDDLIDSAARQLLLYRALGLTPEPVYCHVPLVRGADGRRLAKRHGDTRLDAYRARGVSAERVVGLCAWWCGITGAPEPMSAAAFLGGFRLDRVPRGDVTFLPENDAWLLGK